MTRPNPKRSGGPKTLAGKVVASENALKSGAYSLITLVLPGESQSDYEQLQEQFLQDFSPRDIAESAMVRDLVNITWKKMRVDRLETSAIVSEMKRPFSNDDFPKGGDLTARLANQWLVFEKDETSFLDAQKAADKLLESLEQGKTLDLLAWERVLKALPLLREHLPHVVRAVEDPLSPSIADVWKSSTHGTAAMKQEFDRKTRVGLEAVQSMVTELQAIKRHPEMVQTQIARARDTRLLKFLEGRTGRRVLDDLDRAFYKILNELRRHQAWRRMQEEVTIPIE